MAIKPRISQPGLVQNVDLVSVAGGEAQAAAGVFDSLSRAAGEMRAALQPEMNERARERAAEDVAEAFENRDDPNSLPEIERRRFIWSQDDQVYNNAVQAGMLARAEVDIANEAARLEAEYEFDPAGYENASSSFLSGYLGESGLGGELSTAVELSAQAQFSRTHTAIARQARAAQNAEDQEALELRLSQINEAINTGLSDPAFVETDEFDQLQATAISITGQLVNNPAFAWSDERGSQALENMARAGQEANLYGEVDRIFRDGGGTNGGGYGQALQFIDESLDDLEMSNEERIGLRSRLQGHLQFARGIEDAERGRDERARVERLQQAGDDAAEWEADILGRIQAGEVIPADEWANGRAMVARQGMTGARFQSIFNTTATEQGGGYSAPANAVRTDDAAMATLADMARDPQAYPIDELNEALWTAMGNRQITHADRESILDERENVTGEARGSALETIDSFFAQSGFSDRFNQGLVMHQDDARRDLLDWHDENPDATRNELEHQAAVFSVQRGRRLARPDVSDLPQETLGELPSSNATVQEYNAWREGMLQRASDLSDESLQNALLRRAREIDAWYNYQRRLLTESGANRDQ